MINTTNVTIYLAMILDLEIIGILIKQNFMIWTYFIVSRSNVSFGVFFFFWDYFWPILHSLYSMFWMQNFCSISDFPWPIHSFVLVSPFSSRLWLLYWRYIFFLPTPFFHSSIHSPCWLSVLFLLSKSFQSLFFMPLRGIRKGWSLNYYFSLKQGECRVC